MRVILKGCGCGVPVKDSLAVVRARSPAAVIFYSFGDGVGLGDSAAGGQYYDSLSIENS